MTSLYSTIAPHFTQDLLTPGLKVGYEDDGGVWQFLAPSLAQRLPLRAIEWKNLMGVTKLIDKLPLNFVAASTQAEQPLVSIYLVKCEESETYKSTVKVKLAAWIDAMNAAKVEWMVLYVPLGTRRAKAGASRGTPNAVYKKIFERIRSDFAHKKSAAASAAGILGVAGAATGGLIGGGSVAANLTLGERICKIDTLEGASVLGQQQQHESQWNELLLRLRHCIMDAFQIKCFQYEEELRVLDAKRAMPGWDFGSFFLAKERLALMYQQMYLQDDAIRHLDELDAIFVNLSEAERKAFYDPSAISFLKGDAIFMTSPLALNLVEMQHAIASNCVSARVVLLYSFCRQIRTLYLMGSFPQLLQRSVVFISSFMRQLRELQETTNTIEWFQPYQWAVGACLEIAYACELSWSGHDYQVSSASVPTQATQAITPEAMSRHLGDLLYLARRVLKAFAATINAVEYGSPNTSRMGTPTSAFASTHDIIDEASTSWYEWLRDVFVSRTLGERYERCVWEMSHLASLHFSRAGRHRFAVFLGGECARYHVRHQEFESASRLFRSHARQCEEDKWWVLFGDCVRHICSSELALGRSGQAVAACFSMLQVAQEEKAELGRDYLDQLMNALVESLESQENGDGTSQSSKMNMGELIQPKVSVETMQSTGSDLDYGEIRVTLSVSNRFPAGILVEKLRVRFVKCGSTCASNSNEGCELETADEPTRRRQSGQSTAAPRLDTFGLEEQSSSTEFVAEHTHDDDLMPPVTPKSPRKKSILGDNLDELQPSHDVNDAIHGNAAVETPHSAGDPSQPMISDAGSRTASSRDPAADVEADETVIVLEESNVYLYQKASVNLVFLQADIPVGSYVCSGVECVLAGNAFRLASSVALSSIQFEVAKRESTLQIELQGPPLLVPQSDTQAVTVCVRSRNDHVLNGVLEIQTSGDFRFAGLQLLNADEHIPNRTSATTASMSHNTTDRDKEECKLVIAIPEMQPGEVLNYTIGVTISDEAVHIDDSIGSGYVPEIVVGTQIRYQHEVVASAPKNPTAVAYATEIRRVDVPFRVLRPLVEQIRLKRVGCMVVVGVSLTCNDQIGVLLRDYRLKFPPTNSNESDQVLPTMLQDPNSLVRNTKLRPLDAVHLAFTLQAPTDALGELNPGYLELDVEYTADASASSDIGTNGSHRMTTLSVKIPLQSVHGIRYRIDVTTKCGELPVSPESASPFPVGEDIKFLVRISAFGASPQQPETEDNAVLYLDESNTKDWIVIGKQSEVISFRPSDAPTTDSGTAVSTRSSMASMEEQSSFGLFSTHKRLLATRVGKLRFPQFRLQINGRDAPTERVLYVQSARHLLVA